MCLITYIFFLSNAVSPVFLHVIMNYMHEVCKRTITTFVIAHVICHSHKVALEHIAYMYMCIIVLSLYFTIKFVMDNSILKLYITHHSILFTSCN